MLCKPANLYTMEEDELDTSSSSESSSPSTSSKSAPASPANNDDQGPSSPVASPARAETSARLQTFIESSDESDGEPRTKAPPPPVRHECEMPSNCPSFGSDLHYVKLPNFLSIDSREYDPEFYEDEIDEFEQQDNEGRARLKLKVENTIRWRKVKAPGGTEVPQSNARIVQWSDGTMSLYLGAEIFDVNEKKLAESRHLYIRQGVGQGLKGAAIFKSRLSIRPNSTESFTHRKLTLSLADRSQKTQKIRMLNNPGIDPELRLSELSRREDDKMKATMRRETKQRRVQERSQTRGPDASYLEPDYDDSDENDISLSAIKRKAMSRQHIVDSDESSEDDDEAYSDDSDPEFGKIKRRSERKTKQVVEDSDDD